MVDCTYLTLVHTYHEANSTFDHYFEIPVSSEKFSSLSFRGTRSARIVLVQGKKIFIIMTKKSEYGGSRQEKTTFFSLYRSFDRNIKALHVALSS